MARKNNGSSDRDFSYFVRNIGSKSLHLCLCVARADIEQILLAVQNQISTSTIFKYIFSTKFSEKEKEKIL